MSTPVKGTPLAKMLFCYIKQALQDAGHKNLPETQNPVGIFVVVFGDSGESEFFGIGRVRFGQAVEHLMRNWDQCEAVKRLGERIKVE